MAAAATLAHSNPSRRRESYGTIGEVVPAIAGSRDR
jgi:hypothetical protein